MLAVAPWTAFWERNYIGFLWPAARGLLLSPWLRGAVSGVGVLTFGAGMLDLAGIFLRRSAPSESAGSAP